MLARLRAEAEGMGSPWAAAAAGRGRGDGEPVGGRGRGAGSGAGRAGRWGAHAASALADAASTFDRLGFRTARAVLGRGRALLRAGQRTQVADVPADARA